MKRRSDLLRLLLAIVVNFALVWFVSTAEQQRQYLVWMGLAETPVRGNPEAHAAPAPAFEPGFPAPVRAEQLQPLTRRLSFSSIAHGAVGSPCIPNGVANPTRTSKNQIFRWVDENGRTHFSDKPSETERSKVVGYTADGGVRMFSADYKYLGKEPPAEFKQALQRNIDGVFRVFDRELRLRNLAPLHVNITIVDGKRTFARYRNKKTAGLATTSGYYSFSENEAVVRWVNRARTLAVARHEISHLALGNWVGITPLWFNEGLAEFMESLEFKQSYARADEPFERIEHLRSLNRSGKLPDFLWFLASEREDWDKIGDDIAYAIAWSLVQFLVQNQERQRLISDYLNALSDQRCQQFDHMDFFEKQYEGGLRAFERDWHRWLVRETPVAVQF